jgi:hypothetical protein
VCGRDGKAYGNPCYAACAGNKLVANGPCGTITASAAGSSGAFYDISAQATSE